MNGWVVVLFAAVAIASTVAVLAACVSMSEAFGALHWSGKAALVLCPLSLLILAAAAFADWAGR